MMAKTVLVVNLVDPAGRRFSLYDGRHPIDLSMPRDFYFPHMRDAHHVHLTIMPWARALYDDAQMLGLKVSTDLHDCDGRSARQFFACAARVRRNTTYRLRRSSESHRRQQRRR